MQVNEVTLSDADIDVLQILHKQIMFFAINWAIRRDGSNYYWMARGVISAYDLTAKVLGVPEELILDSLGGYYALIGC